MSWFLLRMAILILSVLANSYYLKRLLFHINKSWFWILKPKIFQKFAVSGNVGVGTLCTETVDSNLLSKFIIAVSEGQLWWSKISRSYNLQIHLFHSEFLYFNVYFEWNGIHCDFAQVSNIDMSKPYWKTKVVEKRYH